MLLKRLLFMMEVVSLAMNWITLIGALAQGKYLGLSKLHTYRAIMVIVCKSFPSYTVKAVLGSGTCIFIHSSGVSYSPVCGCGWWNGDFPVFFPPWQRY